MTTFHIPKLGSFSADSGLRSMEACSDGLHRIGRNGVVSIFSTGDKKVEFIVFSDRTLAYVTSEFGYPAYYPVHSVSLQKPILAVLMDLDGTSIQSEEFSIMMIQKTIGSLLDDPRFEFEESDLPHVSGHSVSDHLLYCLEKYCSDKTLKEARSSFFDHWDRELAQIEAGNGRVGAFRPQPGLKQLLLLLKEMRIKIGLVTSGPYDKAYPAILSAFRSLDLGDPRSFYDVIITTGFPLRPGRIGTLGELPAKPHPWLYAEAFRIGLQFPFEARHNVIGIEDSGAGVCSLRLAGIPTIGLDGGNIIESGTLALCDYFCSSLFEVQKIVR
jgi:beta-phosphoglucomutase